MIIYVFLSVIAFTLGILYLFRPNLSILLFLFYGLLVPSANQFTPQTSYLGIHYYDYFFLSLAICYCILLLVKKKIFCFSIINTSIIFFVLFFYLFFAVLKGIPFDKYLLRDTRPFLMFIFAIIFIDVTKYRRISLPSLCNILIITSIAKLLFFFILSYGILYSDPYYQSNSFRYFDVSTFVASLFLIVVAIKKNEMLRQISVNKLYFLVLLSVLVVLISNLRVLILSLLIVYVLVSNIKFYKKILIGPIFLMAFFIFSYLVGAERIQNSLEYSEILAQLITRFSPVITPFSKMNILEYFTGLGMGTCFEIPWFDYRELDTKHNTLDSLYITLFIKYGIITLAFLFLFFRILLVDVRIRILRNAIIYFYLILFFTMAVFYQFGTVLQIIFFNLLIISINRHENTAHSISISS